MCKDDWKVDRKEVSSLEGTKLKIIIIPVLIIMKQSPITSHGQEGGGAWRNFQKIKIKVQVTPDFAVFTTQKKVGVSSIQKESSSKFNSQKSHAKEC